MKIDLNYEFKTLMGDPIHNPDTKEPLTLRQVLVGALLGNFQDERNLSGEEKAKRFELAMNIQLAEGEFSLKTEDAALAKKLIAKQWTTLICGQAYRVIEGQALIVPKKKTKGMGKGALH